MPRHRAEVDIFEIWLGGFEWEAWRCIAVDVHDGCLLYTSDAADERSSVDLGGRRIIKKKKAARLAEARREHRIYAYSYRITREQHNVVDTKHELS